MLPLFPEFFLCDTLLYLNPNTSSRHIHHLVLQKTVTGEEENPEKDPTSEDQEEEEEEEEDEDGDGMEKAQKEEMEKEQIKKESREGGEMQKEGWWCEV